ncbi:TPA: hypothetical protein ACG1XQ_001799, partial [Klebsiella aerogenes]
QLNDTIATEKHVQMVKTCHVTLVHLIKIRKVVTLFTGLMENYISVTMRLPLKVLLLRALIINFI